MTILAAVAVLRDFSLGAAPGNSWMKKLSITGPGVGQRQLSDGPLLAGSPWSGVRPG